MSGGRSSLFNTTSNTTINNQILRIFDNYSYTALSHWINKDFSRLDILKATLQDKNGLDATATNFSNLPDVIQKLATDPHTLLPNLDKNIDHSQVKLALKNAMQSAVRKIEESEKLKNEKAPSISINTECYILDFSDDTTLKETISRLPTENIEKLSSIIQHLKDEHFAKLDPTTKSKSVR